MKKTISISILLLSGCCSIFDDRHVYITPDNLPAAVAGVPYHEEIIITGSPVNWVEVEGAENYQENGMEVKVGITKPTQQVIEINGIPQNKGILKFSLRGSTPGTQCSGLRFEKIFTIITYEQG